MRRFHIYIGFIVWLLTSLFAVSCNDELEGNGYSFNSSSNLHVLVPTVLSANGNAFSGSSSEVPTYNATVDECQINDLRLYAFPVNGNGKLVAENLPAPLASMMLDENIANYQLTIEPGIYHIYVVANMSDVLKAQNQNIKSEEELKNIVLKYSPSGAQPGMPVCTNIPMIYEPKDINGKTTETEIKATDKSATVIANLKFTCVKVKLNLIFDPDEAKVFSGKSFQSRIFLRSSYLQAHLYVGMENSVSLKLVKNMQKALRVINMMLPITKMAFTIKGMRGNEMMLMQI